MLFPHAMDLVELSTTALVNSFASMANAMMTPMLEAASAPNHHLHHHHQAGVVGLADPPATYSATENHTLNIGVLHPMYPPAHKRYSL
jgi:hypothetical protein